MRNNIVEDLHSEKTETKFRIKNVMKKDSKVMLIKFSICLAMIFYEEIIFRFATIQRFGLGLLNAFFIAAFVGSLLAVITSSFSPRVNRIFSFIFIGSISLYYMIQTVYYSVFKRFLSFSTAGTVGTDILDFSKEILTAIIGEILFLLLLLLPFVFLFFNFKLCYQKLQIFSHVILLLLALLAYLIFLLSLRLQGTDDYTAYDLYHNTYIQEMGVEKLGLLVNLNNDYRQLLFSKDDALDISFIDEDVDSTPVFEVIDKKEDVTPTISVVSGSAIDTDTVRHEEDTQVIKPSETTPTPIIEEVIVDTSPNIINIDFNELLEAEKKEKIKTLHTYFSQITPTNKNEYTGMFEGYNLILLTAEGFSPYAVHETLTPTLYKLTHEGFVFDNFYTPLWWCSTSDGEYVACTSTIPKSGVTSMYKSAKNAMPFCLGNQFLKLDYNCYAFHNHTYTYYHRDASHPNMGYIYKGLGNGLDVKKTWPESDLEMMEKSLPDYMNKEPFHTYYMTVSGHMNYTFMGNTMSYKHRDEVKDLPYSDEAKAYIACNIELDKALEYLIAELDKAGILEHTVIALSADHYPYGLEKEKIDELAGHEVEENFELYKNHFILWTKSIMEPIVISKPCSSLDILPTLSNLFGLTYDSRLMMGRDILSDASPLVIFSNRSYITDKVMYNSTNGEITKLTEDELPEDYIKNMNKVVNNKFKVSVSILEQNYYSYLTNYITKEE